jgi:glutamine synthetase adenylyltransferase
LQDYYGKGDARVWERLALMRARPLFLRGFEDEPMRASLRRMTDEARPEADVIRSEVHRLRELTRKTTDGKSEDLKRCDGGSHAIELLVRMLQLTQDKDADSPTEPDEIAVLSRFREMSILSGEEADTLIDAYGLYRKIDIAVRLFRNRLPEQLRLDPLELPYLHRMIDGSRDSSGTELLSRIESCKVAVHKIFCRYVNDAGR